MARLALLGLLAVAAIEVYTSLVSDHGAGAEAPGSGGSGPRLAAIRSPAAPGSGEPNLFAAGDRVYLSWIEPDEEGHALRFAAWDGERWSEPGTVARGEHWFVNWADFPSLVTLPDGSLAAHWLVKTGPETYAYEVRIARSIDGGRTWSDAIVPHDDGTPTEHGFVSLFPTADGGLGVVWLDGRKFAVATETLGREESPGGEKTAGAEMTLRAAVIDPDGQVRDEALLDDRVCDCCQTGAALTPHGPVVVYRDRSPDEIRDIAVVRWVDGRWTDPVTLHDDGWEISACPVNGPAIAARGDRVAVAWFTAARDTHRVRVAFSADAGTRFGGPFRVDEGAPQGRVDLVLLPDGSALVVWLEGQHGETRILARRVTPGGRTGPAVLVAPASAERASGFPRVAALGNRLVFAWTEPSEPSSIRLATAPLEAFPLSDGSGRPSADPDGRTLARR